VRRRKTRISVEAARLSSTVTAMRPVVPAKDFDISRRFYIDLGFQPCPLANRLVEMRLGLFSFILQAYYVREWVENVVVQVTVSDVIRDSFESRLIPCAAPRRCNAVGAFNSMTKRAQCRLMRLAAQSCSTLGRSCRTTTGWSDI
jgi:hypothetical protein